MNKPPKESAAVGRRRLTVLLSLVFTVALIMGPGPGLYLVNPDPADPHAVFTVAGMPVLYLWAVSWFAVQAAVVLIAYFTLWQTYTGSPVRRKSDS